MEGEGEGREQGVGSRSPTRESVDGYSHHDHQKGDFQVSKRGSLLCKGSGQKGEQGEGLDKRTIFIKCCTYMYHAHVSPHLMNVAFRL